MKKIDSILEMPGVIVGIKVKSELGDESIEFTGNSLTPSEVMSDLLNRASVYHQSYKGKKKLEISFVLNTGATIDMEIPPGGFRITAEAEGESIQ